MGRFSKLERTDRQPGDSKVPIQSGAATSPGKSVRPASTEAFDYPTAIQRAEDHFYKGEYQKALRFYSRALQTENSQPTPWIGQVNCLIQLKQIKEADLWLQRALDLFPEDAALLSLRSIVLARKGMTKRAIGTSDYAMTRTGVTPLAWIARGQVLALADSQNAGFCFEKAMEAADSDDWKTPFQIALFHYEQAIWATALDYFQKANARGASSFYIWYLLGICYSRLSFKQESLDALRQSISMNDTFPPSQEALRRVAQQPFLSRLFGGLRRKKS